MKRAEIYYKLLPKFNEVICMSFLNADDKELYMQSIAARLGRMTEK